MSRERTPRRIWLRRTPTVLLAALMGLNALGLTPPLQNQAVAGTAEVQDSDTKQDQPKTPEEQAKDLDMDLRVPGEV